MNPSADRLDPVDQLAGEFLERHRRGEKPAIDEYAARHPELAEKIREVFAALLLIEDFGLVEEESHRPHTGAREVGAGELRELGDYRILRRIGRGGMGVVYEAEQVSLGRRVALKILPFHSLLSPDHLRRFQLEARAAARLHHPNIVPVHEVGEAGGVHFYAMQLIQGQGLDEVLEELRRLRGIGGGAPAASGAAPEQKDTGELAVGLLSGQSRLHEPPPGRQSRAGVAAGVESGASAAPPETRSSSSARLPGQAEGAASSDSHAAYCRSAAMIGLQVAEALAHAHAAGVVHRDIKPSNLLLDLKGTVWVTDFGLAKTEGTDDLTHSGDLVGTLRYMGPERFQGWSDPRSDVYSLGVTLYELLTLRPAFSARDRPALVRQILHVEPPLPRRLEKHIPRDLETVVLKAIEKEPAKRYSSAAELAEDLRCFLENRPIVARRPSPRERLALGFRRNPVAASLGVAVGSLVLVAAVVASAVAVHLGRLARDLEVEQRSTRDHLRRASLEEARARRLSRRIGQRHQSLEALGLAAAIDAGADLRNEAVACLALHDLRRRGAEWKFSPLRQSAFTFDAVFERYAYSDGRGAMHVCAVEDRGELLELPGAGRAVRGMRFSPDGRRLAALHGDDFTIWSLDSRSPVVTLRGGFYLAHLDFSRDGGLVAVACYVAGTVHVVETATGTVRRRLECGDRLHGASFHPDGRLLAVSTWQHGIDIWDTHTGELWRKVALDDVPTALAWHPSGKLLAAGGERFGIHVWEAGSWERPRAVLAGHRGSVTTLRFSPGGDLLASYGYDNKTIIWDGWLGEPLLEYEGMMLDFSADGRRLGFRFVNTAEVFEVSRPPVYRRIHGWERTVEFRGELVFSPDGRWLVNANSSGVRIWDVDSGDEAAVIDVPAVSALFVSGNELLTSGDRGLHLWPWEQTSDGDGEHLRIGPPRAVLPWEWLLQATLAPDGRTVFVLHGDWEGRHLHLVDLHDPARRHSYKPYPGLGSPHISPDGRWLAGGTWHGSGIAVWSVDEKEPAAVLPAPDSTFVRFSPEGRWLVASDGPEYRFFKVGSWEEERTVPRHRVAEPPSWIAFSPDGGMAALPSTLQAIRLVDLASGNELATLEAPHPVGLGAIVFSPDGGLLAAGGGTPPGAFIHLWDLRELRRELASCGLDWDLPPSAERPRTHSPGPRLTAKVLLGELAPEAEKKVSLRAMLDRAVAAVREALKGALETGGR